MCRVISNFFRTTAISCIIEDKNGDVEDMSIYNARIELDEDPNELFPIGTVFIIVTFHDIANLFG